MQGIDNPKLSDKGIRQSEALAERLKDIKDAQVFSSPLERAYHTARITASRIGTDITVIDDLKEIDIGEFSLRTWDQAKADFPELFPHPDVNIWKLFRYNKIPGQETYEAMVERIIRAMSQVETQSNGSDAILFSHGGFIRIFIAEQFGFDLVRKYVEIENTSITVFDFENGFATFDRINDTHHLTRSNLNLDLSAYV